MINDFSSGRKPSTLKQVGNALRLRLPAWPRRILMFFLLGIVAAALSLHGVQDFVEFEGAVVFALIFIFGVLLLLLDYVVELGNPTQLTVFKEDTELIQWLIEYVHQERPERVTMIQYSSAAIAGSLLPALALAETVKEIQILVGHPESVYTRHQLSNRMKPAVVSLAMAFPSSDNVSKLKVKCYKQPPSIRAINFDDRLIAVGWYTYDRRSGLSSDEKQLWGHNNATLITRTNSKEGRLLVQWYDQVFGNLWRGAVPLDEAWSNCKSQMDSCPEPEWFSAVSPKE